MPCSHSGINCNKKTLDYFIDRIITENNLKNKTIHDNLIRDLNDVRAENTSLVHEISELKEKIAELDRENKRILDANKGLTQQIQDLRGDKKWKTNQ